MGTHPGFGKKRKSLVVNLPIKGEGWKRSVPAFRVEGSGNRRSPAGRLKNQKEKNMKMKLWVCGLFVLLVLGLLIGCNEEDTDGDQEDVDGDDLDGDQEQTEEQGCRHCPCFDDGTCNVGLICEDGTCEADPNVTWVRIPGGTFWMGCGGEGTCTPSYFADVAKPRHQVTVPAFEMTQTEITQLQARNGNPSRPGDGDMPERAIDWLYAKDVCEALGGRLPTEAEWEYAARAGTETDYYCGNDLDCLEHITWYCSGEPDFCSVHLTGEKEPNAFGLYDMIGNFAEFVEDTDQGNYEGAPTDGSAWVVEENGIRRIARSGFDSDISSGTAIGVFKVWLRDGSNAPLGIRCARDIQEERKKE